MPDNLEYVCDDQRHLVCRPYSEENLHKMARSLDIAPHWFHKDHYDIPKTRIQEVKSRCRVVTVFDIIAIIPHRHSPHAE